MGPYELVSGLINMVGLAPEDVCEIKILPGQIVYRVWAKDETGGVATVSTDVGALPLSFVVTLGYEAPHEHGPDTHTHDDDHDAS